MILVFCPKGITFGGALVVVASCFVMPLVRSSLVVAVEILGFGVVLVLAPNSTATELACDSGGFVF